jgi:ATP-binding cassette subfamily B protein
VKTEGKKSLISLEAFKLGTRTMYDCFAQVAQKSKSLRLISGAQILELPKRLTPKFRQFFRHYPHIRQQSAMDCGPTCIAMICQFHNRRANLNLIREMAGTTRHGTSLLTLAETAEKLGFLARGVRANYGGLMQLKMPMLCHWQGNHFVVLYEITPTQAVIGDPAEEVLPLTRAQFEESYSGTALELTPTTKLEEEYKAKSPFSILIPLAAPHKAMLRDIFIAAFVYQILQLFIPLFTQVIVDKVIVHQSISMLNAMLMGMVLLTLFETTISYLRGFLLGFLSMKIDQSLFVEFYRHLLSLPLKFFEQRTIGDVLARFGENEKVRGFLAGSAVTVTLDVMMAFIYLGVIFFYNVTFAIWTCFYLLCFTLVVLCYTPYLRRLSRQAFDRNVKSSSFLVESIRAIEKVKASAVENQTRWHWEELFADSLNVKFRELLAHNIAFVASQLIHMAGQVVLLWYGANLVIEGHLTVGQLMSLNMMVGMAAQPLMRLIDVWNQFQEVQISLERLGDVFETKPEEPEPAKKVPVRKIGGKIKFESVTFTYSRVARTKALLDVTFEAKAGQVIGIVGRSGCGKTTLLKLLLGLYPPDEGRVLIDDQDIVHLSLPDLRRKFGVVSQHEYFFEGTIRENLCFYDQEAQTEDLIAAVRTAAIEDFINSQPHGLETKVNEGAFDLSGGQRQRLAIARALVHDPKILIFDEATSSLDSEAEQQIQNSMAKMREGRTMFLVAHRLSTVRDADLILVMDAGQIVERGTHEALMAEHGLYYSFVKRQTAD